MANRCQFCKTFPADQRCPNCQVAVAQYRAHIAAQDVAALQVQLAAAELTAVTRQQGVQNAQSYAAQWNAHRHAQRRAQQRGATWNGPPSPTAHLVHAVCQGADSNPTQFQH